MVLAAALLAAAHAPARAQGAAADSATVRADSAAVRAAAPDSAAPAPARVRRTVSAADSARRHVWHEAPRWVMARSLLVPGWGQAHNGAWYKALAVAGGEVYLGSQLVQDQRALDDLAQQIDDARAANDQAGEAELVNQYNARLDQQVTHQWFLGALIAYAMVDAYVDAHFRGFELEFQTDPALPAGREPASGARGRLGARLALRWDF